MRVLSLIILSLFVFGVNLQGQELQRDTNLIQFSGLVLDGSDAYLYPVPYTTVAVNEKSRGTFSDLKGFFSIVVEKGDTIVFSAIGYKTIYVDIPDTLTDSRYSIVQLMTQDTFNLPETVVFPWPSKDHFKLEFLAMDVSREMGDIATRNLAQDAINRSKKSVRYDGNEAADFYLRQQASAKYYLGQQPPMNIFNAVAWKQFFDSWKDGKYKKKKKDDETPKVKF